MSRIDIDQARIASPCNMLWSQMKGDDRVRHCSSCKLNVYNVAGMSKAEAEELLFQATLGSRVCMRLSRRADGTIITKDCPVGVKFARRMQLRMAALRFSVISMISSFLWVAGFSRLASAQDVRSGDVAVEAVDGSLGVETVAGGLGVAPAAEPVRAVKGEISVDSKVRVQKVEPRKTPNEGKKPQQENYKMGKPSMPLMEHRTMGEIAVPPQNKDHKPDEAGGARKQEQDPTPMMGAPVASPQSGKDSSATDGRRELMGKVVMRPTPDLPKEHQKSTGNKK